MDELPLPKLIPSTSTSASTCTITSNRIGPKPSSTSRVILIHHTMCLELKCKHLVVEKGCFSCNGKPFPTWKKQLLPDCPFRDVNK